MEIFTLLALGALFLQILFARHTLERRFDMLERELAQLKRFLKETAGLPKEQKEPAEMQPKAPEEAAEAISAPIYKEVKEEVIPSEPLVEIPVQPAFEPVEEQLAMAAEPVNKKAEQSVEPLTAEPAAVVQQSSAVQQTTSTDSEAPQSVAIETTEKQKEPMDYEKFIGENLFGKIGILVFILGIGFFVKYAIDRNWINETLRTVLGFAVGTGMLVLAQRLNNRYKAFSSLLAGNVCIPYYGRYHSADVGYIGILQPSRTGRNGTCGWFSGTFYRFYGAGKLSHFVYLRRHFKLWNVGISFL